jgi:spore coat protein JB
MDEQNTLLARIMVTSFVLLETGLFLDTHPDNEDALAYYRQYLKMNKEAAAAYAGKYGMLSRSDLGETGNWQRVEGPWPWEIEEA